VAVAHNARADRAAIIAFIGIRVIAAAMIVAIVRKARADADAERAKLDARAALVRADENLRAGRRRNAECGNRCHGEKKLAHDNLLKHSLIKLYKHNAQCAGFVHLD
jgi:hypothetical protein